MKNIITLFIFCLAFSSSLKSQVRKYDIYTPKGTPVTTYEMTEYTDKEREDLDKEYFRRYPNATPIYLSAFYPYSSTNLFLVGSKNYFFEDSYL